MKERYTYTNSNADGNLASADIVHRVARLRGLFKFPDGLVRLTQG